MEPVLFNSQLLEDKAPFGAVKCGQKVSFRVRVDPALACKHVEVAFECAPFCTDKTLVLHKTQLNNGYDEFCGQTSFASAGVRFYYLRLICHDKQSVHRNLCWWPKKGKNPRRC